VTAITSRTRHRHRLWFGRVNSGGRCDWLKRVKPTIRPERFVLAEIFHLVLRKLFVCKRYHSWRGGESKAIHIVRPAAD